jgi:hypothetical protein
MAFLTKRITAHVALLLLLIVFAPASAVQAKEASLTDIHVTNTRDHCLLFFRVTDFPTKEMQKAIDNGINTSFTFCIKRDEVRSFWWNKEIIDLEVSHEIQYDSLKKRYKVRLSEKDNKTIYVQEFDEAIELMSEIAGLAISELSELHKGKHYKVSMMAELDKIRLPLYLHYVFFFLSLWDFETDWYTVDFTY